MEKKVKKGKKTIGSFGHENSVKEACEKKEQVRTVGRGKS